MIFECMKSDRTALLWLLRPARGNVEIYIPRELKSEGEEYDNIKVMTMNYPQHSAFMIISALCMPLLSLSSSVSRYEVA